MRVFVGHARSHWQHLSPLLQGVENLITGDAKGLTAIVVTALKKLAGLVLSFLLTQLGLGDVPKDVDKSIKGVRDKVQALLNTVLDGLLAVGKQLLGLGNAQEVSDEDNNRLTKKVPSQDKKVQVWLQKDGKTTVVKVQASPTRNLEEVLQCMLANAPGSLKSEIQTDLNQVQATQNRGQSLAVEADQPVPMGKTGTTTGGDAPAKKRQQIQTKDLVAEANILGKPEYACMINSCALAGPGGKAGAKNPSGTCIDIGSEVVFKWGRANLGVSRVGRRLKGEGMAPCRAYDGDQLRLLRLELEYGDGNGVEAQLLRNVEWTEQNHAVEGSVLWLELPEIGLSGWAKVRAVDGCPEIEEGDGPLVTGWFKHRSGKVYDLVIEGEAKSIGITGTHPVWSVDRQDWVPAAELREAERLLAEDGSTPRVRSLSLRAGSEPVYNIEVDGDHCYRVGQQGLLVHNASCSCTLPDFPEPDPTKPMTIVFKKYLGFDGMARPIGVKGRLNQSTIGMDGSDADPNIFPPGWDDRANKTYTKDGRYKTIIARGHLLAADLSGSGKNESNLVTVCQNSTNQTMKSIEQIVKKIIIALKGDVLDYEVRAVYDGSKIPSGIRIRASSIDPTNPKYCWTDLLTVYWNTPIPNEIDPYKCKGAYDG